MERHERDHTDKIGMKIKKISNAFDQTMNSALSEVALTSTQSFVMGFLIHSRGKIIYQKDIEARFNMKHPTITGILRRLEEKGFVESEVDANDHRFKRISATDKAHEVHMETKRLIDETEKSILQGLSDDELELLHQLLDKVVVNIKYSRRETPRHKE